MGLNENVFTCTFKSELICDTEYLIADSIVTSIVREVVANKDFYFSLNC